MQAPWPDTTLLAPLTRGGNQPFRRLCVDFGAVVTCSEMAYAHQLLRSNRKELALLRHHESETFFGVQLAGNKPEVLAEATRLAVDRGAKFVDLNCGCPIHDVVRRGMGARLMQRPKVFVAALEAMVEASDVPITVKIRSGFKQGSEDAPELARLAEEAGVASLTLHGRTREQRYQRTADWDLVRRVTEERSIPIIGNGDVLTWYEAESRMSASGAAGLMVARGALIKPWIFQELLEGRELCLDPRQRLAVYLRLVGYFRDYWGTDELAERRTTTFLAWHYNLLHRYRALPQAEWGEAAAKHPLLQTREAEYRLYDPLELALGCRNKAVHPAIAQILWHCDDVDQAADQLLELDLNVDGRG